MKLFEESVIRCPVSFDDADFRLLEEAQAAARKFAGAVINRSGLDAILNRHSVPARLYGEFLRRLATDGFAVATDSVDECGDFDGCDGQRERGWNGDGMTTFITRTRHELLTAEEEVRLAKRIEVGALAQQALDRVPSARLDAASARKIRRRIADGGRAKHEFALANVRLVIMIATRHQGRGLELDDLIQEGWIGLTRAVERFDYRLGCKFSTYATWWVRQGMQRALADQGQTIRLPVHAVESLHKLQQVRAQLTAVLGRAPTVAEVACRAGVPLWIALRVLPYEQRTTSLEAAFEVSRRDPAGAFASGANDDPAQAAVVQDEASQVRAFLSRLSAKERDIIERRFGIGHQAEQTLEEIGTVHGVTRERIRQIEAKALAKLRARASTELRNGLRRASN